METPKFINYYMYNVHIWVSKKGEARKFLKRSINFVKILPQALICFSNRILWSSYSWWYSVKTDEFFAASVNANLSSSLLLSASFVISQSCFLTADNKVLKIWKLQKNKRSEFWTFRDYFFLIFEKFQNAFQFFATFRNSESEIHFKFLKVWISENFKCNSDSVFLKEISKNWKPFWKFSKIKKNSE